MLLLVTENGKDGNVTRGIWKLEHTMLSKLAVSSHGEETEGVVQASALPLTNAEETLRIV